MNERVPVRRNRTWPGGWRRLAVLAAALLSTAGCIHAIRDEAPSPLRPIRAASNSCMVDLFFVRFPISHAEANSSLWDTIDEQLFSPETRRQLAENGFRVGVSGNRIPTELSQLLEIEGKPLLTISRQVKAEDLLETPNVIRAQQRLMPGQRQEVICSEIYAKWPLLLKALGGLQGETLELGQAIMGVRSFPTPDGSVKIRLQPEVQYGEHRRRFVSSGGVMRVDEGRNRREFNDLTIETTLSAGQMLVLTCLPDRPGSLGWRFFTRDDKGTTEQRMLVIRLSHVRNTTLLGTPSEEEFTESDEQFGVEMFRNPSDSGSGDGAGNGDGKPEAAHTGASGTGNRKKSERSSPAPAAPPPASAASEPRRNTDIGPASPGSAGTIGAPLDDPDE